MTSALHSQTVDTEYVPTEPAPCEDETQSVHAWAEENDDTELIQRRSWKLPLAALMLAIAGLAAGITVWPHHSTLRNPAAPPQAAPHSSTPVAPAVTLPPVSPDVVFINTLNAGIKDPAYKPAQQGDANAILMGHDVCTKLSALYQTDSWSAYGELTHQMVEATGMPDGWASAIVLASTRAYCPQYQQH